MIAATGRGLIAVRGQAAQTAWLRDPWFY